MRMLCQKTMSTLCSSSMLAQFAGMKLLAIIAVTWEDREVTLRRKNFENFGIYNFWTKVTLTLSVSEESF